MGGGGGGGGGGGAPIIKSHNEVENGRVHRKGVGVGGALPREVRSLLVAIRSLCNLKCYIAQL